MAQRLVTSFVNTNIPDAYLELSVQSNPVGLGASGNIVIIGEADGGESYSTVALKDNWFTPDQLAKVQAKYISGQIVDAFRALSAPSADSDISGSANRIYVVKTNAGQKAQATIDTDYGTLRDKNWGKPGNNYKYQITAVEAEQAPTVSGTTIPAFGAALNGAEFQIRLNGSATTTITLSGTSGDHATIAALIIELNAQLPAGIVASLGAASNSLKLTVAVDATANRKGWGKSFELIDSSADLTSLGLAQGLTVSAQEPIVELAISRSDTGLSETLDASADVAFQIGYLGTTATLTINFNTKTLTTTVTGGTGANLTIDLTQYRTLSDLATYISAQTGYTASTPAASQQLAPANALDALTAQPIATSIAGNKPGRVKKAALNWQTAAATSVGLEFVATATAGLPAPMASAAFLAGGTRGNTLAADVAAGIDQCSGISVNIVVPLFSRDATADIADALTASGSTYTIAAVNALAKNHCIQYSTAKLKKNRIAICSIWDTYANAKIAAQGLANYRVTLAMQRVTQVNSVGTSVSYLPWYAAAVAAGMQAGGFYKSICNKAANVISYEDPAGYDSGSPGDVEDALDAGLLVLSTDPGRNYWVSDQTTYGYDTNFVYNSIQAVYCSDLIAVDLALSFKKAFVGKSLADVDAGAALSYLAEKMDGYKRLKLIASSDDAPLGYKNPKVTISAPEMDVQVEIKLATAIYFIPISVNISQVQQAA